MNFRQRLLRLCTLGCGMLLILSPGLMVNTALAIPLELKQSLDADKHKPEIAAAVTAEALPVLLAWAVRAGAVKPDRSTKRRVATEGVNR